MECQSGDSDSSNGDELFSYLVKSKRTKEIECKLEKKVIETGKEEVQTTTKVLSVKSALLAKLKKDNDTSGSSNRNVGYAENFDIVTSGKIQPNIVTSGKVQSNIVTSEKIQPQNVTSGKVQPNIVTSGKVQPNIVTSEKVQPNIVTSGKVQPNIVTSEKVQPNIVTSGKIQPQIVTSGKVQPNIVTSGKVQPNIVTSGKIQPQIVTSGKVQSNIVTSGEVQPSSSADGFGDKPVSCVWQVEEERDLNNSDVTGFYKIRNISEEWIPHKESPVKSEVLCKLSEKLVKGKEKMEDPGYKEAISNRIPDTKVPKSYCSLESESNIAFDKVGNHFEEEEQFTELIERETSAPKSCEEIHNTVDNNCENYNLDNTEMSGINLKHYSHGHNIAFDQGNCKSTRKPGTENRYFVISETDFVKLCALKSVKLPEDLSKMEKLQNCTLSEKNVQPEILFSRSLCEQVYNISGSSLKSHQTYHEVRGKNDLELKSNILSNKATWIGSNFEDGTIDVIERGPDICDCNPLIDSRVIVNRSQQDLPLTPSKVELMFVKLSDDKTDNDDVECVRKLSYISENISSLGKTVSKLEESSAHGIRSVATENLVKSSRDGSEAGQTVSQNSEGYSVDGDILLESCATGTNKSVTLMKRTIPGIQNDISVTEFQTAVGVGCFNDSIKSREFHDETNVPCTSMNLNGAKAYEMMPETKGTQHDIEYNDDLESLRMKKAIETKECIKPILETYEEENFKNPDDCDSNDLNLDLIEQDCENTGSGHQKEFFNGDHSDSMVSNTTLTQPKVQVRYERIDNKLTRVVHVKEDLMNGDFFSNTDKQNQSPEAMETDGQQATIVLQVTESGELVPCLEDDGASLADAFYVNTSASRENETSPTSDFEGNLQHQNKNLERPENRDQENKTDIKSRWKSFIPSVNKKKTETRQEEEMISDTEDEEEDQFEDQQSSSDSEDLEQYFEQTRVAPSKVETIKDQTLKKKIDIGVKAVQASFPDDTEGNPSSVSVSSTEYLEKLFHKKMGEAKSVSFFQPRIKEEKLMKKDKSRVTLEQRTSGRCRTALKRADSIENKTEVSSRQKKTNASETGLARNKGKVRVLKKSNSNIMTSKMAQKAKDNEGLIKEDGQALRVGNIADIKETKHLGEKHADSTNENTKVHNDQSTTNSDKALVKMEESKQKPVKKRGKTLSKPIECEQTIVDSDTLDETEKLKQTTKPKRGRGRPRKVPSAERGRPRKVSSAGNISETVADGTDKKQNSIRSRQKNSNGFEGELENNTLQKKDIVICVSSLIPETKPSNLKQDIQDDIPNSQKNDFETKKETTSKHFVRKRKLDLPQPLNDNTVSEVKKHKKQVNSTVGAVKKVAKKSATQNKSESVSAKCSKHKMEQKVGTKVTGKLKQLKKCRGRKKSKPRSVLLKSNDLSWKDKLADEAFDIEAVESRQPVNVKKLLQEVFLGSETKERTKKVKEDKMNRKKHKQRERMEKEKLNQKKIGLEKGKITSDSDDAWLSDSSHQVSFPAFQFHENNMQAKDKSRVLGPEMKSPAGGRYPSKVQNVRDIKVTVKDDTETVFYTAKLLDVDKSKVSFNESVTKKCMNSSQILHSPLKGQSRGSCVIEKGDVTEKIVRSPPVSPGNLKKSIEKLHSLMDMKRGSTGQVVKTILFSDDDSPTRRRIIDEKVIKHSQLS